MTDKVANFLKTLDSESLSKLAEFVPKFTGQQGEPSGSLFPVVPVVPVVPDVAEYYDSGPVMTMGAVFTIVIIIWYIIKISIKFTIDDEKVNKNFEYIDSVLFGDSGIFPMIFNIWVVILATSGIFSGLNYIISSTNSITPNIKTLPSIIERLISLIKSVRTLMK